MSVQASAATLPFDDSSFAEARSWGLLHHLSYSDAIATVREMHRVVVPNGRIVVCDNVWPNSAMARPLAWMIRKLDRGEWIRTEDELVALLSDAVDAQWDRRRLTYAYTGLEALILEMRAQT